jgi:hypothetical protein
MDSFENENLNQNEFEISVTSLTELDRARILYNHIWHSGLAPEYVDELYREKRYRTVIDHDNYNPRLISFITDVGRLTDCPPNKYWQYIRQSLDNPADIWENPFVAQQDDFGRATVFLVTLNGRAVAHDDLAEAYSRFVSLPQNSSMSGHKDFLTNLRHLTGSLLSRTFLTSDVSRAYVNLFSPAIGDFVLRRYAKDIPSMKSGFLSLRSVSSVDTLGSLHKNKYIGASAYREILRALLAQANGQKFSGYSPQYIASIAARIIETKSSLPLNLLHSCVDFVIQEEVPGTFLEVAGIISWGQTSEKVSDEQAAQFVVRACENSPNSEEIKMLVDIASDIEQASKGQLLAIDAIKVAAMEYLMENMDEEVDDDEVFNGVEYDDSVDARHNLELSIGRALDRLGVEYSDREVEEIGDAYEFDDKRDEYFENEPDYPVPRSHASVVIESDEIDELFERTSMPRPS